MPSAETAGDYTNAEQDVLLGIACTSILHGLTHGQSAPIELAKLPSRLSEIRASFVTLTEDEGRLRGCIGSLEAYRPLAEDVNRNAWAAAFRDPRFPPLEADEFAGLEIHVSVLSEPETLAFDSEQDLLARMRPGIDGLILADGAARGTFLPSVWESLPEPAQFLAHLKLKAGLPADYWSDSLRVWRYTTLAFGESLAVIRSRVSTT